MKKQRTAVWLLVVAILCFLFVMLYAVLPILNYVKAVDLYNESRFEEAQSKLMKAGGYKNSSGLMDMCTTALALENSKPGDTVEFGKYDLNGTDSDGSEKITWIILEAGDSEALLISRDALDARPYNSSKVPVTWESSSLRKWLNGSFLQTAFTASERSMIATSEVKGEESSVNVVESGNDTNDLVYLLSLSEFADAFPDRSSQHCTASSAAASRISDSGPGSLSCWLRSSGYSFAEADAVTYYDEPDGGFSYTLGNGFEVDTALGVRPVIRLAYGKAAAPGNKPVLKIVFGKGTEYSLNSPESVQSSSASGPDTAVTPAGVAESSPTPVPPPSPGPSPDSGSAQSPVPTGVAIPSPSPAPTPVPVQNTTEDSPDDEPDDPVTAADKAKIAELDRQFKTASSKLGKDDVLQVPRNQITRVGADDMYSAYRLVITSISGSLGKCDGTDIETASDGLALAQLVDFDDGFDELFVLFKVDKVLYEQVYRWDGKVAELVFSRRLSGVAQPGMRVREFLYQFDGHTCICSFSETLTGDFCPSVMTVYESDGKDFVKTEVLCAFVSPETADMKTLESYESTVPNLPESYRLFYKGCIVSGNDITYDDTETCRCYYNQDRMRDLMPVYSRYDFSSTVELANQKWMCIDYGTLLLDKDSSGVSFEMRPFDYLLQSLAEQSR